MNRQQVVSINGNIFSNLLVHSGVPQGSVLGPVLFLLYINDIPNSVNILKPFLFADDTSLYYSSSNIKDLEITINNDLEQIQEWFLCNKLSLNIKKSNFVTFHSRQKKLQRSPILKIDKELIEEKEYTKYLGITIDKHLSWKAHINTIKSKLSQTLGIIFKARYYTSIQVLKQIFYSLFYPYLSYGILLWGNTYPSIIESLRILQRKLVRTILRKKMVQPYSSFFRN